jgi:predicted phosphoadenosine phosphosulfate sulfurtransferase
MKKPLGKSVLDAARERISLIFDRRPQVYVSFSGGKDSSVMLHLIMDEAKRRGRIVGLLFIDLEAQYNLTIEHVQECFDLYKDHIKPYWIALPIALRNAVSMYEPKWLAWDPDREQDWVRQAPQTAITSVDTLPFFRPGMEFEEFIPD